MPRTRSRTRVGHQDSGESSHEEREMSRIGEVNYLTESLTQHVLGGLSVSKLLLEFVDEAIAPVGALEESLVSHFLFLPSLLL